MSDRAAGPPLKRASLIGEFAVRHQLAIAFISVALCIAGIYSAFRMPSSVFPQTDFPRCVILVDNGTMPADEMMATITRPIEEAMKDIPGARTVRSTTGRGSAEISVFFDWDADMVRSELYVNARLSQIRSQIPGSALTTVWRLTFAAFPIIGVSLTSPSRDITALWETARYELKPRFLRIPGVARVDLVGGRTPEHHVIIDPLKLAAAGLSLEQVSTALEESNLIAPVGMHEEDHTLYLVVVDGRAHSPEDIENLSIAVEGGQLVRLGDLARVVRGREPVFNVVTAEGVPAVLLNIRSQPDGSTLQIAAALEEVLVEVRNEFPPDLKLAYYYDQSLMVRASVASVWEAIVIGLSLSAIVLFLFLRHWGSTLTAIVVIPVTLLITLMALNVAGLGFDLMTLGGVAAAIGLVIDDAIVVVEAIYAEISRGTARLIAIHTAIGEIFRPLVGSTFTPVVVFLPLALLDGITGVFFRALALTMVVALLTSLLLALTLTPLLASWFIRDRDSLGFGQRPAGSREGPVLGWALQIYEKSVRSALSAPRVALLACGVILALGAGIYQRLESEFLPPMDEGGFVIDYVSPWGTSLAETHRQLLLAEEILREHPSVESFSRRTGARLALSIAEPNTGDFLVKLRSERNRSTEQVISDLRHAFHVAVPGIEWEFPGILGDLIGDLTWSPDPIEVKLFSTDTEFLERKAPEIEAKLQKIAGVVDSFDGLVYTGPTISLHVRHADARRFGLNAKSLASAMNTAMLGRAMSSVLEGDRVVKVRVLVDANRLDRLAVLRDLPLRGAGGALVKLSQVADVIEEPGQLELHREDLRQLVAVTARLENRDLGSAMAEIRETLGADESLPPGTIEFGGLYQQQQQSFRNLMRVMLAAIFLVFSVLLLEFRSFAAPAAIVFGAVLALFGAVTALWATGTSLNVVSFLGAIIGVGIVAKNGILMLDAVTQLQTEGLKLVDALVCSGRRRLRPVLMTSLTTLLAMLPLAYGIGAGADMLKPLAIAIMGSLSISVVLSLVATPVAYQLLSRPASN